MILAAKRSIETKCRTNRRSLLPQDIQKEIDDQNRENGDSGTVEIENDMAMF